MIYGAAKAAVNHLTRCVGMELGEHNVRVNSVSPGAIATGILAKALGMETAKAEQAGRARSRRSMPRRQPIPRAGMPDDIAQCVAVAGLRPLHLRQRHRHRRRRRRARRHSSSQPAPRGPEAGQGGARHLSV